ncbi:MAG: hypothetical protein R6X19_06810 [Kiritimatiellia bacterium]
MATISGVELASVGSGFGFAESEGVSGSEEETDHGSSADAEWVAETASANKKGKEDRAIIMMIG